MIKILKNQKQIDLSRNTLKQKGFDYSQGWRRKLYEFIYSLRFRSSPEKIAHNKSWDTLCMLEEVEKHFSDKKIQIFEMGSFNSEIPLVLWGAGYHNIRASDFNPLGRSIRWYGNNINFKCEDFYNPSIKPESVDVITALSVIEHGYDQDKIFKTISTLLKKGGIALLTTDYHEPKIDVPKDFRIFNLPYMIFSKAEIEDLVNSAKKYGLHLIGPANWENSDYPIKFLDYKFTFIFVALQKR